MSGHGTTISTETPRIGALQIQSSSYGMSLPIVFGTTRLPCNLIWYGDFTAIAITTTSSSGGKGGSRVKQSNTTYIYSTALAFGLCEGPINSVGAIWQGKMKTDAGSLGLSVFSGSYSQTPWGYLTSKHPGEALNYHGIAYAANASYFLGSNASLPNHSFEVTGFNPFGLNGIIDANPADILANLLTNAVYGALFPSSRLGPMSQYSNYCVAYGLFLSPAFVEQKAAHEHLSDILLATNSAPVWSEGLLKIIPYGDTAQTGNGATYTPNITPLYDLTDDDFLSDGSTDPVIASRKTPADAYNQVQIEFMNRANDYNIEIVEAKDQANIEQFGLRPMQPLKLHMICDAAVARTVAQLILQRSLYIRNTYQFSLGWKYILLEPMDIVTLTDAALGLNRTQVRITEIEEDEEGALSVTAEEFPFGVAHSAVYASQVSSGYGADYNISVGNVSSPIIIPAPGILTVTGYEVWLAVGSQNGLYGGCSIWVSQDNITYKKVGILYGSSRYGTLTAPLPAGTDPDTANTCSVDLTVSLGNLLGGTQNDADQYNTLSYVDGELISFQDAVLTSAYHYDLKTYLRRGIYNTPIGAHASGTSFIRLDNAIFRYAYDPSLLGQTLYFKFTSFNIWGGGEQGLSDVNPYTFTINSSLSAPGNVQGFSVGQNGNVAVFQWQLLPDPNIAGYEIRYAPPAGANWDAAIPLTKVTRGTQITSAALPPGTWTVLIKARDTSGVYSRTATVYNFTMTNTHDVVLAESQQPDWLGTLTNFVRHWTGVLVPDDQHTAAYYGWEVFDQYVPTPFATCIYETPEMDLGFVYETRVWMSTVAQLGPGESGFPNPQISFNYNDGTGYVGYTNWTINNVSFRYARAKLTLNTADGVAYIAQFTPTLDVQPHEERLSGFVVTPGGTTYTFVKRFYDVPTIQMTMQSATGVRFPEFKNITPTGCEFHVYDGTGADVGGTVDIIIRGD